MNENYWEAFYSSHKISGHSLFAEFSAAKIEGEASMLEFGCGDGRDAFWLSGTCGWRVSATDRVAEGWRASHGYAMSPTKKGSLRFSTVDLAQLAQVQEAVKSFSLTEGAKEKAVFYSRFVLHSITPEEERNLLHAIRTHGPTGHHICFEYRTVEDASTPKVFDGHERRYIHHTAFLDHLRSTGYSVEFETMGQGMAPYKGEDPFVGRVIAQLTA